MINAKMREAKRRDDIRCGEYIRVQMLGGRHQVRVGFADHQNKEVRQ